MFLIILQQRISFKYGLFYLKRISKQRPFICYQEQWNLLTSAFLNDDVTCVAILGQILQNLKLFPAEVAENA